MASYQDIINFCREFAKSGYVNFPSLSGLEELPPDIGLLKNIRHITFANGKMTSFPKELGGMVNLEYLRIHNIPLVSIPNEIKKLQKLHFLELDKVSITNFDFLEFLPNLNSLVIKNCSLKAFPDGISKIRELRTLELVNNQISNFPDWFGQLHHLIRLTITKNPLKEVFFEAGNNSLKSLSIENCQLEEVPESIELLTQLKTLVLKKNKLRKLPSSLNKLGQLNALNISNNPLEEFPAALDGLTKLQYFIFDEHWIQEFPYSLLQLKDLIKLSKRPKTSPRASEIAVLAREVNRNGYSYDFACFLMDILAERWEKVEKHPKLLEALNCQSILIQNSILDLIYDRFANNKEALLDNECCISVMGKTSFNLNDLRSRLKDLGMGYSARLNAKVSHLVIGRLPKNGIKEIIKWNPVLLTEHNLMDFLNEVDKPFLLEAAEANAAGDAHQKQLSGLLLSASEDNVNLALEMLKSGGVPEGLLTELLLVYFNDYPKKTKNLARKLLVQYGPASIQSSFSKTGTPLRQVVKVAYNALKFKLHFEPVCEEHGLDKLKILRYWIMHKDKLWPALMKIVYSFRMKLAPPTEGLNIILGFVKDGLLKLDQFDLSLIPESLLKHASLVNTVTRVSLNNCKLQKFPAFLWSYKNLEHLYLENNSIRSIPKEIKVLSNLEYLSLSRNSLKKIPASICLLPKLKTLLVDTCPISSIDSGLSSCKALRRLSVNNNRFEEIPEVLFEMKQLEDLQIKRPYRNNLIPYKKRYLSDLVEALPGCKVIG